ncbi:MAG: peptidase, partial [Longimicrobiales bacterium]
FSAVTGDPLKPEPLFGHGPDFGYFYYGAIWYGDELWNGGMMQDVNDDGRFDDVDALDWDESGNQGQGFREWTTFQHPVLGTVEIGGFRPKFFAQNPPADELERWARNQALFNLEMAYSLPQIEWGAVDVRQLSEDGDSATYEVAVSWRNSGALPTALRQAQLVKIVQEDRAQLEFDEELTEGASPRVRIIDPETRDKTRYTGWTEPGEVKRTTFRVRTYGGDDVTATVQVLSTRGGVLEREITLGG